MSLKKSLAEKISNQLGSPIVNSRSVTGGCISEALVITTEKSEEFFLKINESTPVGFFQAEAEGLNELRKANILKVPEVIVCEEQFIILEALTLSRKNKDNEIELGRGLAELHQVQNEQSGFVSNNFIGSTKQINTFTDDWPEFFFKYRLLYQAQLGKSSGWFTEELESILFSKEKLIKDFLAEGPSEASLLHGDLWSGNVFWSNDGPALIDPAVYYGSREADLAMTELFSGFSRDFYQAYEKVFPMISGYQKRREVLNLYHLMNHANLFAGTYINSVAVVLHSI